MYILYIFKKRCLIPQSFTMHYIDDVLSKLLIKDPMGNAVKVMVQMSGTLLYFIAGCTIC